MKKLHFLLLLVPILLILSCDNKLDVTSDFKEVTIVYGLLDFQQPTQYIKINKAFLSNGGDAYIDAQNEDSLYQDTITAKLIDDGGNEILLQKTVGFAKNTGVFNSDVNVLYTTNQQLNPNSAYRLVIENEKTGFVASSITKLVMPPIMIAPFTNNNVDWLINPDRKLQFKISSGRNSIVYDILIRFHYDEINAQDTNQKTPKYIDWPIIINKELLSDEGFVSISTQVDQNNFYNILEGKLEIDQNILRRAKSLDIITYGGGKEINNYITVSEPSIGIVQKQTDYSNITNGAGIFSSRHIGGIRDIKLDNKTVDILQSDSRTSKLNFID